MPKASTPAEPDPINLRGKMATEIAALVADGTISQEEAEAFVASRAVAKLHKAMGLDNN